MGIYLNPGNVDFNNAVNHSEIYVDKTEMIKYTNKVLFGEQKFICVSRPRRFGKSIAANMLTAYYSRGCDSRKLFGYLKIAKADSFKKHLNLMMKKMTCRLFWKKYLMMIRQHSQMTW